MLNINFKGATVKPLSSQLRVFYKQVVLGTKRDGTYAVMYDNISNEGTPGRAKAKFVETIKEGIRCIFSVSVERNKWEQLVREEVLLEPNSITSIEQLDDLVKQIMSNCRELMDAQGVTILENSLELIGIDRAKEEQLNNQAKEARQAKAEIDELF